MQPLISVTGNTWFLIPAKEKKKKISRSQTLRSVVK
jgi:hypothetical protein